MQPPQAIADLIDARQTPTVGLSPDRRRLLLLEPPGLPPIERLAQEELRLAGLRINPGNHARSRASYFTSITLLTIADRRRQPIAGLPKVARIGHVTWSPDSSHIAFMLERDDSCELWRADVERVEAKRWGEVRLNAVTGSPLAWHPDSQAIVCETVPADRGPAPSRPLEVEPLVQENLGRTAPARTFQDLLKGPHDEDLFEHYLTSQLVRITLDGETQRLNAPQPIGRFDTSPDGNFLLVETIERPYSYLVPASRFARRVEIWNSQGEVVHHVTKVPLAEEVPVAVDAVRTGPRAFGWRSDAPATLFWAQAADGGDPANDVEVRDELFLLPAPFDKLPQTLARLGLRFYGMAWGDDHLALVREGWWKTRRERLWRVAPDHLDQERELLFDRSTEDRYHDPGRPLLHRLPSGHRAILKAADGESIYLLGGGATPEGSRPFVDRFDLRSKETTRLWRSEPPQYESPVTFLDERHELLLLGRESIDEPTNYYTRDLSQETLEPVTDFPHPTPQLADVQKEILRYQRADGVTCTATLYLPGDYDRNDGPLPALFWVYPQEYKSADAASQMSRSPHRFVRVYPYSPLLWLTQGFAIVDGPTMPIVGEGDTEPNDTYVEQLVASAEAAVEEVARRGVVDRERIAIGGHSYGGFTVANLLAHCDLFRAGIAASGAYNRTLTPFGFQAEDRPLWEAPEIYVQMSPFMHAKDIRRPLLLIHGMADENPGTHPLQSERFYQALQGLGATARLVMLPHEGHVYQARQSLHRVAAEITMWLRKYVESPPHSDPIAKKGKEISAGPAVKPNVSARNV